MIDIGVKCRALLNGRMWLQSLRNGSATATWLQEWKLAGSRANPPHVGRIPTKLEYLYQYALDMAYIVPPASNEPLRTFKRRVYSTLYLMAAAVNKFRGMRITQRHPDTNWKQVWKNLHTAWVTEETTSVWYTVVHDIVPTNERLYAIRLVESGRCRHCDRRDTLIHRLTACSEGMAIWWWTQERLAQLLRTDPRHIPDDWCLRPHFLPWPPQRHKMILWILAHFVSYRMQRHTCH